MNRDEVLAKWDSMTPRERDALVEREIIFRDSKDDPQAQAIFASAHLWCKHYSSDISAAWEVVEKADIVEISKSYRAGGDWYWGVCVKGEYTYAKTVPEAICKAALLSLISEEDKP